MVSFASLLLYIFRRGVADTEPVSPIPSRFVLRQIQGESWTICGSPRLTPKKRRTRVFACCAAIFGLASFGVEDVFSLNGLQDHDVAFAA